MTAWVADKNPESFANAAGWGLHPRDRRLFRSLCILSLSGIRWLGAVTPIGGIALLVGWVLLFLAAARGAQLPPWLS